MAVAATTIHKLSYNSSTPISLEWSSLATDENNVYLDVDGMDGSKVIFIVAHETTDVAAGTTILIGTSDSATTRSASAALFSAAGLNRMKLKLDKHAKATKYARFRSTGTTHLHVFDVLGPFETARFKDSDGHINVSKRITGSTLARIAAILLP